MIAFDIDVTVKDYEAFCLHLDRAASKRAARLRNNALAGVFALLAVTAYYAYAGVLDHPEDYPLLFGPPTGFIVLSLIALEWLRPYFLRRRLRHLLGNSPRESFLGPHRVEVSAEGLYLRGEQAETRAAWSSILRLDETEAHLFLMLGHLTAIIIPRRDLPADARDALRQRVQAAPSSRQMIDPAIG